MSLLVCLAIRLTEAFGIYSQNPTVKKPSPAVKLVIVNVGDKVEAYFASNAGLTVEQKAAIALYLAKSNVVDPATKDTQIKCVMKMGKVTMFDKVLFAPEIVLLVKVSVVSFPTRISVATGRVNIPVFEIVDMTGNVKVLLVRV